MSFNVGENIGPYRIVEQLGQGGMATVFKAYHASLDRYVAIKALHPAFNQEVAFESRFQREARVVAKLEHPNIVPVYDYAEHEKRPYLVMKFIEGITLKARMEQSPLTSDEVVRVVDAVGAALAYAHKQGVLHRDIKPSNVLLATDGQIYLADFGLARMAQAGESTLSSDSIMGTPQYISPEQAMGKSDLDQRTDLYSFGVMMYEMAVGKVPYSADTPFSIIHDHIYTPLPLPRQVNPKVTEEVERVLLKALSKEREDRFEDATALVTNFKTAWSNIPTIQTPIPQPSASQVIRAEQKTAVQAMPVLEETKAHEEKMPVETVASSKSEKKRSPWMWVSIGLVVILCLGFLTVARNNRLFARLRSQQQAGALTPLPGASINEPPAPGAQPNQPPVQPPPGQGPVSGGLADVEQLAREHPDDLDAQLNLAVAYWDAGMEMRTMETLPQIIRIAGPDNHDFYERAGNTLKSHEAWLPATVMFFQAVRSYGDDVPPPLMLAFHEAAYNAANHPEIQAVLPFDVVSRIDPAMAMVALARNNFFNGKIDQAHSRLNEALQLYPDMYEARLLEAEIDSHELNYKDARRLANDLINDPTTPLWIRAYAGEIIKRLPQ